jgi:hypothetical protein
MQRVSNLCSVAPVVRTVRKIIGFCTISFLQMFCDSVSVLKGLRGGRTKLCMIERRLKVRVDYSHIAAREQLVFRFNAALGPPSEADLYTRCVS